MVKQDPMKNIFKVLSMIGLLICLSNYLNAQEVTGELKEWHKVTLILEGPETSEQAEVNPFLNYRLNVTFTHKASNKIYKIPGYFASDGNAGNTSAE